MEWHAKTLKNSSHSQDKVLNHEKSSESEITNSHLHPNNSETKFIHDQQYNAHEPSFVASSSSEPVFQKAGHFSYIESNKKNDKLPFHTSLRKKEGIDQTKIHTQNIEKPAPPHDGKKLEIMSLLSMIFSIVGLIAPYVGFAFIVAGLVLGILGLIKINKNSDVYWGRGFAIAGISVSAFAIFLIILLIAFVGSLFLLGL